MVIDMQILQTTHRGFVLRETGSENQDRISKARHKDVYAAALCDGAGSHLYAGAGAEAVSRHMAGWLARNFERLEWTDAEEIKLLACIEIQACLDRLRRQTGCLQPGAFASTLIACAMRAGTGEFLSLHLGDGMLAASGNRSAFRMLTKPVRQNDSRTVLTVSPMAEQQRTMQVSRGRADRVIMASDGAEGRLYFNDSVLPVASALADSAFGCRFDEVETRFSEAVGKAWRSMDDLSIVMFLKDLLPTPEALGYSRDQSLSQRRRLRAFSDYAAAREAGCSDMASAVAAGWRDKPMGKRRALIRRAHAMGIM